MSEDATIAREKADVVLALRHVVSWQRTAGFAQKCDWTRDICQRAADEIDCLRQREGVLMECNAIAGKELAEMQSERLELLERIQRLRLRERVLEAALAQAQIGGGGDEFESVGFQSRHRNEY